jgi:hypothetical protein
MALNLESTGALNVDDELVKLELESVLGSIDLLAAHPSLRLADLHLNPEVQIAYDKVKLASSLLYDTDNYSLIARHLSTLPQPEKLLNGTVGAYLFGCVKSFYGAVDNRYCTPLCIGSLLPDKNTNPLTCCPYQVWTYENGDYTYISGTGTDAYVYILNGGIPNNTDKLRLAGINNVQYYDGEYNLIKEMAPIEGRIITRIPQNAPVVKQTSSGFNFWLLLLILVILGLLGWWLYKSGYLSRFKAQS